MALYQPPTRVVTSEQPFLSLVTQADPAWSRDKYWAPEYVTSKRIFWANPYQRGAYNRLSNVYPVGQQYGGLDPLVIDNLEPSYVGENMYVANPIPGLYQGVPDGMGWA